MVAHENHTTVVFIANRPADSLCQAASGLRQDLVAERVPAAGGEPFRPGLVQGIFRLRERQPGDDDRITERTRQIKTLSQRGNVGASTATAPASTCARRNSTSKGSDSYPWQTSARPGQLA